ncbi:MAG: DUF4384 domain-containing protein [Myxococcota bacterium]
MTLHRSRTDACLSDLQFDDLLTEQLSGSAASVARAHIDSCRRCADRHRALAADRAEFAANRPAFSLEPGIAARPSRSRWRTWQGWLMPGLGLAAAAAVLALAVLSGEPLEPGDGGTRLKGGQSDLDFYVKRGDSVTPGTTGQTVYPDDAVRFTYSAERAGYLAILSHDGAGLISVYHSDSDGDRAAAITTGWDLALPDSIILDDVLGTEHVHGFFCDRPAALSELRAAVRSAPERPEPPAACRVRTLTLTKRATP